MFIKHTKCEIVVTFVDLLFFILILLTEISNWNPVAIFVLNTQYTL